LSFNRFLFFIKIYETRLLYVIVRGSIKNIENIFNALGNDFSRNEIIIEMLSKFCSNMSLLDINSDGILKRII